ncbi:putative uncharacterized protein DDB_G0282133 [Stegodyphus dumicola]|uniref:putative uncharacterized protein DDB_G0282133 n=1 Tax=Stegodyphus dumicola TaxID=202533 RepID=UPI0015AE7D7B|nr:putative uncharacterized protein DDB_G0282133 [Stegodyphus dumicola]
MERLVEIYTNQLKELDKIRDKNEGKLSDIERTFYNFLLSSLEIVNALKEQSNEKQKDNVNDNTPASSTNKNYDENSRARSPIKLHDDYTTNTEEKTLDQDTSSDEEPIKRRRGDQTVRTKTHKPNAKKVKLSTHTQIISPIVMANQASISTNDQELNNDVQTHSESNQENETDNNTDTNICETEYNANSDNQMITNNENTDSNTQNSVNNTQRKLPPLILKENFMTWGNIKKVFHTKKFSFIGQNLRNDGIKVIEGDAESYRGIVKYSKS